MTTVRTADKVDEIRQRFSTVPESRLGFSVTGDISSEGAFEKAVQSDWPFDVVVGSRSTSPLWYLFEVRKNRRLNTLSTTFT